jgi:hypothetical protein
MYVSSSNLLAIFFFCTLYLIHMCFMHQLALKRVALKLVSSCSRFMPYTYVF